jgi:NADPH:quinone reductase-like Zn-dependent oxidoreductase
MRAIVYAKFGTPTVLHVAEVPMPTPKNDEVLVRVHATTVAYGDLAARNFKNISRREFNMPWALLLLSRLYFGFNTPRVQILGSEFSGEVVGVGKHVSRFRPGHQVFGYLGQRMGAYAEYLCIPQGQALAMKPANMSHEQAACVPYGAMMATSLLRSAHLKPGQRVLIIGASGSIGSAALQLAKVSGTHVTAVCHTSRLEYVRALGAHHVIGYDTQDFTQNGETYDLIFDVLGKSDFSRCRSSLTPTGIYFPVSFKTKALFQMLWTKLTSRKRVVCSLARESLVGLVFVKQLIEEGKYTSIVDRVYSMEQAGQAHSYAQSGERKASVVISLTKTALSNRQTNVALAGPVEANKRQRANPALTKRRSEIRPSQS